MAQLAPFALVLAMSAVALSAQARPQAPDAMVVVDGSPGVTRFKCQDGGDLLAAFASRQARLIAVVDAGDGPHALPIVPWTGGPAVLTWTDGRRTLTWSPGVQIMWMDGAVHRMCGREHRH